MEEYCRLARNRKNVYLDTSGVAPYYRFGQAVQWAGVDRITFASDGFMYIPLVEKAKIEALRLPVNGVNSLDLTPRLSVPEVGELGRDRFSPAAPTA